MWAAHTKREPLTHSTLSQWEASEVNHWCYNITPRVMVLPTFSWIFMCYSWVAGGSQGNVLTRLTHMIRETEPKLGRQDLENIYNKHSSVSWSINGPEKHEKIVNQAELRLTTWAVCSSNPVKVIVTDAGLARFKRHYEAKQKGHPPFKLFQYIYNLAP